MSTTVHLNAEDTSNYVKHTHPNPIQRRLIDRFHGHPEKLKISGRRHSSMPDAGRASLPA